MDLLHFFKWLNNDVFALPSMLIFLGAGIFLTIKTKFLQIRGFSKFVSLVTNGISRRTQTDENDGHTMDSIHALFTAMGTTIGIGNVVGPSLAIMVGGPGALFWLITYIIIGSATKFTEVVFAILTREKTADGHIIGGPMRYLYGVAPWLAVWYGFAMSLLMAGWSGVQANTLASILALENVPTWATGLFLAGFVWVVLKGGSHRVGLVASKLVPLMFVFYISFATLILLKDPAALMGAVRMIFAHAFTPAAISGAFMGATVLHAMRYGIYRGIFITESGIGTSSIPHSMADAQNPSDQGLLAMFSSGADAFLSLLSGLLVLVTGVWTEGTFRSTLMYEVFRLHSPVVGRMVLTAAIALFALTTVMGNSFNGRQAFASLTGFRWVRLYILFTVCMIFLGSQMRATLVWEMMDTVLIFVAVPNIIGLLYLTYKNPQALRVK